VDYTIPSLRMKGETGACVRGEDYANENKKSFFFFLGERNEYSK
jgi:hypothetical protein